MTEIDIQARNQAILYALDQGAPPSDLATRYGISPGQVYAIAAAAAAKREGRSDDVDERPVDDTERTVAGALIPIRRWNQGLPLPERFHRAVNLYERHAEAVEQLPDPDDRRDPRAARYHQSARTENTRRMYRHGIWLYLKFCEDTSRREVPSTPATMEAFAVHLMHSRIERGRNKGQIGMAPNSIRLYLSAVRTFHRIQAENPPDLALAGGVVTGYENEREKARDSAGRKIYHDGEGAKPLRLPTLAQMFDVCDPATLAGQRDRALLSCGWAIMSRRKELTLIDMEHLTMVDQGLEIRLPETKTMKKGRTVGIPDRPNLGKLNPVPNVLRWRKTMIEHELTGGPFFRGVDRHGRIHGEEGWAGSGELRLHPATVEEVIRRVALAAGMPPDVVALLSGHSLRRGGANDMYASGADTRAVARQGGWGENSPVVFRYLEDVGHWERNALEMVTWTYPDDDLAEEDEVLV